MGRGKLKTRCWICLILLSAMVVYILDRMNPFALNDGPDSRSGHQLLLVGAGSIGVRHLQSLLKFTDAVHITVVDPSGPAILRAQRICDQETNSGVQVSFVESLDTFPVGTSFEVGIIATNSDVRRVVIEDVLACCSVKHLILEKVLFQTENDHLAMQKLFERYSVNAYVHAQWPTVPFAKYLKSTLQPPVNLHISGNSWGLCCNSIHFLTLAAFLNDQNSLTLDGSNLQPGYVLAKRQGFVEIFGDLSGRMMTANGVAEIRLRCSSSDEANARNITVSNQHGTVTWNEKTGLATGTFLNTVDQNTWSEKRIYPFPMVSSWTRVLVKQLLSTGLCDLPLYENVYKMSIELNDVFLAHLAEARNDDALQGICPIT